MKMNGFQLVSEAVDAPALTPEDFQQLRRAQEKGGVKGATVGALGSAAVGVLVNKLLARGVPNPETAKKIIRINGGVWALAGLTVGAAVGTLLARWRFKGQGYGIRNKQVKPEIK